MRGEGRRERGRRKCEQGKCLSGPRTILLYFCFRKMAKTLRDAGEGCKCVYVGGASLTFVYRAQWQIKVWRHILSQFR